MLKFLSKLMNKKTEEDKKETPRGASQNVVPEESSHDSKITYDDFKKVQVRVGEIISAEKVENTDKLLCLKVNFGNETRQIVSGISEYYSEPSDLVGKKVPFVTNLAPRKIRGVESDGMIMAAIDRKNNKFSMLNVDSEIPAGTDIS